MSDLITRLDEAAAIVRGRTFLQPTIGVVLGSGLGAFADSLADAAAVPFDQIPHFPAATVPGHSGALVVGRAGRVPIAVLKGRVHAYEGHSLQDVCFPIRVLSRIGIRAIVMTNAAGAINPRFRPGELMILSDHINLLGNPLLGPNETRLGPRFPDMTDAYDPELRQIAAAACATVGVKAHEGVYIAVPGPSYETPAEIRMARILGADAVGMSTVPEVIAARHMGIRVLALSCLTNPAAGVSGQPLAHDDVLAVAEKLRSTLLDVLNRIVAEAAKDL
jgi:purine-nucleoside phosphorylase